MKRDKTVKIGGVTLPVHQTNKKFIPDSQEIIACDEELAKLAYAVKKNLPTLMIGETGVGKTALIRYIAKETMNGFRRLNLNGQTAVDEFVGKILLDKDGTYWQDGVLLDAMKNGYWLFLDEINAALPEILFALHALLDDDRYVVVAENKGEIVRPHKNFRIFAAMNPTGKYTGTKELNKAFLSRFPIILQVDFPSLSDEKKIIRHYSRKIPENAIFNLVRMARDLRVSYQKNEIEFLCSTRDLINCAKISEDIGLADAVRIAVLNRCQPDDFKAVNTVISLYFGTDGQLKYVVDFEKELKELSRKVTKERKLIGLFAKDLVKFTKDQKKNLKEVDLRTFALKPTSKTAIENLRYNTSKLETVAMNWQRKIQEAEEK